MRFFHLVWLFLLCSLAGLVAETCVSAVVDGQWESRAGFVIGPLSPIYGAGAVLFTLGVNPLRSRAVPIQFIAASLLGGVFEYAAGWFFETCFGIVAWSYINEPFNFHGHTCVGMALVWGLIGTVWTIWALPRMVSVIDRIPEKARMPLTALVFTLLALDAACTLMALDCWYLRAAGNPPAGVVQQFFAMHFDDGFMQSRFETMSMWPVLASR